MGDQVAAKLAVTPKDGKFVVQDIEEMFGKPTGKVKDVKTFDDKAEADKFVKDEEAKKTSKAKDAGFPVKSGAATDEPATTVVTGREEGAGMDPVKIREALGLSADASDEDVKAKLAEGGLIAASAPARQEPETPGGLTKADIDKITAAGAVVVDPAILQELQEGVHRGDAAWKQLHEQNRDRILDEAVRAGKFPPARRKHWELLYQSDPEGTTAQINQLAAGLVPTSPLGSGADLTMDHENDTIYASLYPKE